MRFNVPLGAVKVASVTALAGAACAMGVLPAGAATAAVTRYATTTVVSVPKTGYTLTNITLSATEKGLGGNPTGTVTFWVGGRKLCHGSLYRRKTSCDAQFTNPGTKTITAKYSGNAMHKPSSGTGTIKVTNKPATGKFATTVTINNPKLNAPVTTQAGHVTELQVTVTSAGGGTPTGTVEFLPTNLGPGPYATDIVCNVTLANGTGECPVDPPVGTWGFILYQATYLGDATHTGNATVAGAEYKLITPDPTTTTVEGPATASVGSVTITADVVPDTYGGPTYNILAGFSETGGDTVNFTIDGTTVACAAAPLQWNAGTTTNYATCTTNLAGGTHTVVATYSGDEYTNPSTSDSFTIQVNV
jgi:Bacterial Ig-like domain (group 3)